MTRTVLFTPPARDQFVAAVAYIQADKPSAARGFRALAFDTLNRLVEFPNSGRVIPEFPQLDFREVLVGSHRFFYRVVGETIWVVGVWHDAQISEEPRTP